MFWRLWGAGFRLGLLFGGGSGLGRLLGWLVRVSFSFSFVMFAFWGLGFFIGLFYLGAHVCKMKPKLFSSIRKASKYLVLLFKSWFT